MEHVKDSKTSIDPNAQDQKDFDDEQCQRQEELLRIRVAAVLNDEDNKQVRKVLAIPAARRDDIVHIHISKDYSHTFHPRHIDLRFPMTLQNIFL
jgi:hypothetical protein